MKINTAKVNLQALSTINWATRVREESAEHTEMLWFRQLDLLHRSSYDTDGELSGTCDFQSGQVNLQAPRSELSGNQKRTFRHEKVNLQAPLNKEARCTGGTGSRSRMFGLWMQWKMWNSSGSSGPQFQIPSPYEIAGKMLRICNDQREKLLMPVRASWRPEHCVRLARIPEKTGRSAQAIHSARSELKHSYQFHVISIFKCNESMWSSKGVVQ
jgi:hypothetical protein